MGKPIKQMESSTPVVQGDIERSLAVLAARKQFVSAAMNMGWQLALTVIISVIVGVKIDEHFNSSPSYTLAALVIACGGVIAVIRTTIKQVNREQADNENNSTTKI